MDKYPYPCFSAGHGLSSRHPGKTDPGANVVRDDSNEDDYTLYRCRRLVEDFRVLFRGTHGQVMLRNAGPFYRADDDAVKAGCDLFVEIHLNAGGGTGTEVLYEAPSDRAIAHSLSAAISTALHLSNRGAKRTTDIAVLQPHRGIHQVLIELFFADNKTDLAHWKSFSGAAELAIVNVILAHYGWRKVKSLPRKWSRAKRALYRPY